LLLPHQLSASAAARAIREKTLTAQALVASCLARIAAREPQVQAWTAVDGEAALAAARQLDREPARSPLHGVPIGVKDVMDAAGLPTCYHSPIYRGHYPRADAAVVALAREAGMIVLGKTATQEFATRGNVPATRNPHELSRTPGGSSSGSAAAVADGMIPLALSTQTAGSIVRPASYCGVVGFKPSFSAIATAGMKAVVPSFDTIGVHSRSVEDAEAALRIFSGAREAAPAGEGVLPRVGICRQLFQDKAEPASLHALDQAAQALSRAGVDAERVELDETYALLAGAHDTISDFEGSHWLAPELHRYPDLLSAGVREKLARGAEISEARYLAAWRLIEAARRHIETLWARWDVLLTVGAPGVAPLVHGNENGDSLFSKPWTALGLPCVGIPAGKAGGLPVGLQVIGPWQADLATLRAADFIRKHTGSNKISEEI
jgi:Asp-tRNA(Asn)/Glu-tRNA(Gln) amidotransferase A subunit family amidase